AREPGQIREEAALSETGRAPRGSLTEAEARRERPGPCFEGGCTVRFSMDAVRVDGCPIRWVSTRDDHGEWPHEAPAPPCPGRCGASRLLGAGFRKPRRRLPRPPRDQALRQH